MINRLAIILFIFVLCATNVGAQDFDFGKVSKSELEQTIHPMEPEANAAILYREVNTKFQQSVSKGFYTQTEVFERIKIYNKDGFDYATKTIKMYLGKKNNDDQVKGVKAFVFSLTEGKVEKEKLKNSAVFKEKKSEYIDLMKFTMPNVKPGDVIDLKYTVESSFISNIDEYKLQEKIPVDNYEMSFAAPEYYTYKMHQKGFLPFKVQSSSENRTMKYAYESKGSTGGLSGGTAASNGRALQDEITFKENRYFITKKSIPSIKAEPLSGNLDNYIAGLKFELSYTKFPNSSVDYYSTTWDDVCETIYKSSDFGGELNNVNFLNKEMASILGDANSKNEKIIAAFEYVKKNTTWDKYTGYYPREGLKETFKNGKGNAGDINLLLVAILREAGISANPILVSTLNNGIPVYPTRNGFNFVICGVEEENNVILLDATSDSAPDILDPILLNWKGRLIRKDGTSTWVPLVPVEPAVRNSMLVYDILEGQTLSGKLQKRLTGHLAANFRENYGILANDEISKQLEKKAGNSELNEVDIKYLNDVYKPIQYQALFNNDSAVEEIGGKLYFSPLLFLATEENVFKAETRDLPIYFGYPQQDRTLVTINIPEGYKVESLPESVNLSLGADKGFFKFVISESGNTINLSVDSATIQPVFSNTDYGDMKQFFELVVKKENEKVVLIKV